MSQSNSHFPLNNNKSVKYKKNIHKVKLFQVLNYQRIVKVYHFKKKQMEVLLVILINCRLNWIQIFKIILVSKNYDNYFEIITLFNQSL